MAFGQGVFPGFLIYLILALAGFVNPFLVDFLDGFLDIFRQRIPFLLVHRDKKARE